MEFQAETVDNDEDDDKIWKQTLVPYLKLGKDAFYSPRFSDIKNRKIWLFSVVLKSYKKN